MIRLVVTALFTATLTAHSDVERFELVPVGEPIGTAHPLVVEHIDPGGRWAVVCQAREDSDGNGTIEVGASFHGALHGDGVSPYLIRGNGPGEPIDAWVDASANGDALALFRDGALVVLSADHDEVVLDLSARGADTRALDLSVAWCASFDADGTRVAWARGTDGEADLVVTRLADGHDTVLPLDGALVQAFWFDENVDALTALVIAHDTNEDGEVARPLYSTSLAPAGCRGPVMSFSGGALLGDTPVLWHRRLRDGAHWVEGPTFAPIDDGRVVWGESGGLTLERLAGDTQTLCEESTDVRLVALGAGAAVFAVEDASALFVAPDGTSRSLDVALRVSDRFAGVPHTAAHPTIGDRVVVWDVEGAGVVIDMVTGATRRVVGHSARVVGDDVVTLVGKSLVATDFATGSTRTLCDDIGDAYESFAGSPTSNDRFLVAWGLSIDTHGRVAPIGDREFHVLAPDGRVLCSPALGANGLPSIGFPVSTGPLQWYEAREAAR